MLLIKLLIWPGQLFSIFGLRLFFDFGDPMKFWWKLQCWTSIFSQYPTDIPPLSAQKYNIDNICSQLSYWCQDDYLKNVVFAGGLKKIPCPGDSTSEVFKVQIPLYWGLSIWSEFGGFMKPRIPHLDFSQIRSPPKGANTTNDILPLYDKLHPTHYCYTVNPIT